MYYVSLFNTTGGSVYVNCETLTRFRTLAQAHLFILKQAVKRFPHLDTETLKGSIEINKKTGAISRILFDFSLNGLDCKRAADGVGYEKTIVKSGIIYSQEAAEQCFHGIGLEGNDLSPLELELALKGN